MSNDDILLDVDAGHGGSNSTPGKRSPDGTYEWNYNDIVVRGFINELSKYSGVAVRRIDDASGKTDIKPEARTKLVNARKSDYYFSFHQNAWEGVWGSHGGTETFYGAPKEKDSKHRDRLRAESKVVAKLAQDAVMSVLGLRNRGIKDGDHLWIIRKSLATVTILIECGFMDSTTDIASLRNKGKMEEVGRAVARAFAAYKKLPLKVKPVATPVSPKTMYRVRKTWADAASQLGAFTELDNAKSLANKNPGYTVFDNTGRAVYTYTAPKPVEAPKPKNPYEGKKLSSKVEGLRYYSKPSWEHKDVVGYLGKGVGFPTIVEKIKVGTAEQYKVKNSKGQIFYVTASPTYVTVK